MYVLLDSVHRVLPQISRFDADFYLWAGSKAQNQSYYLEESQLDYHMEVSRLESI